MQLLEVESVKEVARCTRSDMPDNDYGGFVGFLLRFRDVGLQARRELESKRVTAINTPITQAEGMLAVRILAVLCSPSRTGVNKKHFVEALHAVVTAAVTSGDVGASVVSAIFHLHSSTVSERESEGGVDCLQL
jgi:hypothetical protein